MSAALGRAEGASQQVSPGHVGTPSVVATATMTPLADRGFSPRGAATFGRVLVSDLRHFLDMHEDAPGPARRLGAQLGAIVRAGSARPFGTSATSGVGCTKRPGRRPCEGYIMVFRHGNGQIAWACDVCGDEGVITGWEGSPTDVSGLDDGYAEGETIAVEMSRSLFDLLRGVLVLDAASELLIARAQGSSEGVVLAGSSDAFDELVGYVASEANAETDRRRARVLGEACTVLEAALVEE